MEFHLISFAIGFTVAAVGAIAYSVYGQKKKPTLAVLNEFPKPKAKPAPFAKDPALDRTKRNSLQPGSSITQANDLDEPITEDQKILRSRIAELQKAERESYIPESFHEDLQHNFYGTSVTIGKWSRSGLDKRLHVLEITQNRLYIDQQPQPINPTDLEHIKQVLQQAKTEF